MTNTTKEKLDQIEWGIWDVEFERLKKQHASSSMVFTQPKPAARASANSSWQYRVTTLKNGQALYELRTGSGDWSALPKDRTLWPADVRKLEETYETAQKKRVSGGRMISASVSGGLKVS
jgi:hypothetical protein